MISNSLWLTVSCGVTNTKPNPKDSRHLLANVRKVAKVSISSVQLIQSDSFNKAEILWHS
jgi:hypothetical protein